MSRKNRRSSGYHDLRRRIIGDKDAREENVISMINVIFLLLLYFMVVGNLQSDYDVVPPFSTRVAEAPPQIPTLYVNRDGMMWFENRNIDMDKLKAELSKISGQEKLKIHADARVDALTISKIMNASAKIGILQFVLVTQHRADAD